MSEFLNLLQNETFMTTHWSKFPNWLLPLLNHLSLLFKKRIVKTLSLFWNG